MILTMKSKKKPTRLYEFRIKYQPEDSVLASYHYYSCENAEDAVRFQKEMMANKNWNIELLSVEKMNPYNNKWEDESWALNE